MSLTIKIIILTVTSFVATNIDDLVIDTFLFAEIKNEKEIKTVVVGKYLGLGFLVLVSIIAFFGLNFIPFAYIRYLGVISLCLGIKEILHIFKNFCIFTFFHCTKVKIHFVNNQLSRLFKFSKKSKIPIIVIPLSFLHVG